MLLATRNLTLRLPSGDELVPIELFSSDQAWRGVWSCRYTIGWPHGVRDLRGAGVDPMQAIQVTMSMIGAELYTSPYHESGHLVWTEPERGYGFPVANNIRHVLIGDDALYL